MPPVNLPWRSVSWKVIDECNYRCSYCLQKSYNNTYPDNISEIVDCVNHNLGEPYEVKIAGGEIFIDLNKLIKLTEKLVSFGHWISICTNFFADVQNYFKFLDATLGCIYTFAVSLHLEYADPYMFLDKCKQIKRLLPDYSKFQVHNVITKGVQSIVKLSEIKKIFEQEGIIFYNDLLEDKNGKYVSYTDDEEQAIMDLLGDDNKKFVHKGKLCRAGDTYFALLPNLDAWICWDSYNSKDQSMYLGNMLDGTFILPKKCTVCTFDTCSCPTPAIRHKFKLV